MRTTRILNRIRTLENGYKYKKKYCNKVEEYDYPSMEDIAYLFNKKMQKDKNSTTIIFRGTTIRRDLLLRFLNTFYNKEFSYFEAKNLLNDRDGDESFLRHWEYLLNYNYIEQVEDQRFKFCDRVKKWKAFK